MSQYRCNLPISPESHENASGVNRTEYLLGLVEEQVSMIDALVEGVILTGSIAWGAYYAPNDRSDIDLVFIVDSSTQIESVIKEYITRNIISTSELRKCRVFNQLHKEKKCDEYSVVYKFKGVKISIDFIFKNTVKDICILKDFAYDIQDIDGREVKIRTVKEFCSKLPKKEGYTLDYLTQVESVVFHPEYQEVKDEHGKQIGYIWSSLVDGKTIEKKKPTYLLGVKAFYFAISPVIIFDKENFLQEQCDLLRRNIVSILDGEIVNVTRRERMSNQMLNVIRKTFKDARELSRV